MALLLKLCGEEKEIREKELGLVMVVVVIRREAEGRTRMVLERTRVNIAVQVSG